MAETTLAEPVAETLTIDSAYGLIEEHLSAITALRRHITSVMVEQEARVADATQRAMAALTPTEERVARQLVYTHLTAPEIARELYISTNTVKTHLKNIYRKLGVYSRSEAVAALKQAAKT